MVIKPSELTSLSTLRFAELALEAGIPPGVVNVVVGPGSAVGKAIGMHPDIHLVAFTGSGRVGRLFLQYSADSNMKRLLLECGGKSPQIIFPDVASDPDLIEKIADNVTAAAFWNASENCSCGSRLIVHKSLRDLIVQKIISRLEGDHWRVGSTILPTTKIGPMIHEAHMEKVLHYIQRGRAQATQIYGAPLDQSGRILQETGGYFVHPTIFIDVENHHDIARDEIFGPVLSVIQFDTEDEAIAIANDTEYGLAASLYTKDLSRAHTVAKKIRAGTISINHYSEGNHATPFGGFKSSGFMGRDKSVWAHYQYQEMKTIYLDISH